MGRFAKEYGDINVKKEIGTFQKQLGINSELMGLGVDEDKQLELIGNLAKDKKMSWLEKFSQPFKQAFNAALKYEKNRQIGVIQEFFDDMAKIGHSKIKLYVKQGDMVDHLVEYDDSGQKGMLNGTIAIKGKTNQMKAKFALAAMKDRGFNTITVWLKKADMKDHYVEVNDNGKKIPFMEKVKEL